MFDYWGFWLNKELGNNIFAYQERQPDSKLWIPKLSYAGWEALKIGERPVFAEKDDQGEVHCFRGLQHFLFFEHKKVPVYIFDNHNHALAFWYCEFFKNTIQKGISLVHVDQHSDMNENSFELNDANREIVSDFTNYCCNVGNFILPALKSGLLSDVQQVRSEYGLLHFEVLKKAYILDIDLDFWEDRMGIEALDATLQKTKNLIASAKLVTVATSPYFLDQSKALELIHQLLD